MEIKTIDLGEFNIEEILSSEGFAKYVEENKEKFGTGIGFLEEHLSKGMPSKNLRQFAARPIPARRCS